jgi:hypothetical protein
MGTPFLKVTKRFPIVMKHLKTALNIIRLEANPLLITYFSESNVDGLQNEITKAVKAQTGITISRQSDEELVNIMIYMFQNYKMIVTSKPLKTAVKELNAHVFNVVAPMVLGNVVSQSQYINYISKPREPIPLAISTTTRGKDVFEYRPGIK